MKQRVGYEVADKISKLTDYVERSIQSGERIVTLSVVKERKCNGEERYEAVIVYESEERP